MTSLPLLSPVDAAGVDGRDAPDADRAVGGKPSGTVGRKQCDSLAWTFRNGFDAVLERLSPTTWLEPASQGWQRVKANAVREVWRAAVNGRVYYVKYYRSRGLRAWARTMLRGPACRAEWESGIYALRAGVAAAEPAGYAVNLRRRDAVQSLLVTEAIEPAQPLNDFWLALMDDADAARRRSDAAQIVERLAEMIARAHQAGFEHLDMHAANILVQAVGRRTYRTLFVDLHSARMGVALDARAVVRNLAQLNQWFRRHASIKDRLRFLRAYLRWRNEYEHAFEHARPLEVTFRRLVELLVREAETHARRLWAQRDRRIGRNGKYFSRVVLPGGWRGSAFVRCKHGQVESRASGLVLEPAWWREQLADPLRWFDPQRTPVLKNSHSAAVTRAVLNHTDGALPVIIKRPLSRNLRRAVAQRLAPSRSLRGWRIGQRMIHRDVPTARPLAVLERRIGPLVLDSLLITEAVPGAVDLETYLRREHERLAPRDWRRCKRALLPLLVAHVRQFHERGFVHRDCKAANILVVPHAQSKLLWIDLDGVRSVRRAGPADVLAALTRLHVSLLGIEGLTTADRARFLKSYFARFGGDPNAWRRAWRRIVELAGDKLAARAARRAWKLAHYGRA